MSRFKVGDKVRFKGNRGGAEPQGMVGTVLVVNPHDEYAVEFDDLTIGHNLEGLLHAGSCKGWWCSNADLELVGPRQWPPKASRKARYSNIGEEVYV